MSFNNIRIYYDVNAFNCNNYAYSHGLSNTLTFEEAYKIAKEHNATGLCRHTPKSKWYLRNQPINKLISSLENPTHKKWPGMVFYVLL